MSREDPQMKIRLPAELKAQIETAAKDSNRTLNAEIVARLQASFNHVGHATSIPPSDARSVDQVWQDEIRQQLTKLSLENQLTSLQTREATLRLDISRAASQLKDLQLRGATEEDVRDLNHALAEMHREVESIVSEREDLRSQYDVLFKKPSAELPRERNRAILLPMLDGGGLPRPPSYSLRWDTLYQFAEQRILDRAQPPSELYVPRRSPNARRPLPKKPPK